VDNTANPSPLGPCALGMTTLALSFHNAGLTALTGADTIPPHITAVYNGDFNVLRSNLNRCIDGLQGLVEANKRTITWLG